MKVLTTKIPPPIVAVVSGILMWVISVTIPIGAFELPFTMQTWASIAIILAGTGIMASGLAAFRKSKTTVNPLTPENASSLVLVGIYRVTRNPMYLGMLLILSAWGLFLGNAVTFLVLAAFVTFMNNFQIYMRFFLHVIYNFWIF